MESSPVKKTYFLSEVPAGQSVRLVRIAAGHGLTGRLAAMGLVPGETIEVLRNDFHGQLVVQVKNTKIVFGRGMSEKLEVAPL